MTHYFRITLLGCLIMHACGNSAFLDPTPDMARVVPQSLEDLQAILDNTRYMNGMTNTGAGITPIVGEIAADDYYFDKPSFYPYLPDVLKNCYIRRTAEVFLTSELTDWDSAYQGILYANLVLQTLPVVKYASGQERLRDNLEGSALFHRAHFYYHLAQIFCPHYQTETAAASRGLPLRLTADVNEILDWATLQQTYGQIIGDLQKSIGLLAERPSYATRPSRMASYALLARTYLTMGNYQSAFNYADSCLQIEDKLMDYNTLDPTAAYPFERYNDEVIYACLMPSLAPLNTFTASVDSNLLDSYEALDLRRSLFFHQPNDLEKTGYEFRGSYDGNATFFSGIARDEMYLIRAEANARMDRTQNAMVDLNAVLRMRFKSAAFEPRITLDATEALTIILDERRKELVMRGLRWTDLRRLNTDPRFARTLIREMNGERYELAPNDPSYVFPIPSNIKAFHPEK